MIQDYMALVQNYIFHIQEALWGFPMICLVAGTAAITSVALGFVQFTGFFTAIKTVFGGKSDGKGEINSMQAFLKVLSTGLGNGALAGVAMAVHQGGPGAAFWIFAVGFLGMILRFCEVFLANMFSGVSKTGRSLGGPFLYLQKIPGGSFLPTVYAVFCLGYGLFSGSAMQCNSIRSTVTSMIDVSPVIIAVILTSFIAYTLLGGARRIVKVNGIIVPLKVILFFAMSLGVFIFHWAALPAAIMLILKSAFTQQACLGGLCGVAVQRIISLSLTRAINASESGLGTAGIVYGATGSSTMYSNGLSAMFGTFVSVQLVCTMVAVSIVVSGALGTGATGAALTSAAFQTVFGQAGGWATALLSVLFGMGVFIAYGFIGRECWLYLTNDRFEHGFTVLFCAVSFWGSISDAPVVWAVVDIMTAGCFVINLFAILWLLPQIRKAFNVAVKKGS